LELKKRFWEFWNKCVKAFLVTLLIGGLIH
jgi:hypothetical protein